MQLVCPAGNLPALRAAVDAGADAVYVGFRDQTNARAFPGLNFDEASLRDGIAYAHAHGCQVYLALNTYPDSASLPLWRDDVDRAPAMGCAAISAAAMAVLDHAMREHPNLPRHLSVQGSATSAPALRYMHEHFGIARAVLPRVLSLQQVERLCRTSPVPLEGFGFGGLCIMGGGRWRLSSCVAPASPNRHAVCSPARRVRWEGHADGGGSVRLSGMLVDRCPRREPAGYPAVRKGRFDVRGEVFRALEEPSSLNTLELL